MLVTGRNGTVKTTGMAGPEAVIRLLSAPFGQCWPATLCHKAVTRNLVVGHVMI